MVYIQCYNLDHTRSPNPATVVALIECTLGEEKEFELETVYRTGNVIPKKIINQDF